MIKIAFVIDTVITPAAGSEKQLLLLLEGLDRSRIEPHLVCLHDSEWLREQKFDFPLVKYDAYSITSLQFWKRVRDFAGLCKRERYHIVQTFFVDGNIFGTIGARLGGVPLTVATRRNIGNWHNWTYIRILRQLKRWTTRYLTNSRAAAAKTVDAERVSPDRTDVIYNGLDLTAFKRITPKLRSEKRRQWGLEDRHTVIGIVANLRDVKNIESLLRAAAKLAPDYPDLRFVSIGEGNRRSTLETLRKELGIEDRFLMPGRDTDVISCLAAFDIGVLTSRFESFSNSLIEYMAAGLPVVASDVGGNGEAVEHETNGLLYDVDRDGQLETALRRYLDDPEWAARLGRNARKRAHNEFSREACLRAHEAYYENLVRTGGKQSTAPAFR